MRLAPSLRRMVSPFRTFILMTIGILVAASPAAAIEINEIRTDHPGNDVDEYFELVDAPGTSLDGVTYIVIGEGAGGSGYIEMATSLNGFSIQSDGFFSAHNQATVGTCATYDAQLPMNFENSDNVTHLIVTGFTGAVGDDVDLDNDGVLDNPPWTEILDCVALMETDPNIIGEKVYCDTRVGPINGNVPGHVYKCSYGWEIGPFENCAKDTPGAANTFCGLPSIQNLAQQPSQVTPLDDVMITADITDPDGTISRAQLFWESSQGAMQMPLMTNTAGDTYEATIPAKLLGTTVWWYVEAEDDDGNIVTDPPDAPATRFSYLVQEPTGPILLNEIRTDHPGADTDEYFELLGTPGTSLDGITYIVIGEGTPGGSGVIEMATGLNGFSIQPDGLFSAHNQATVGTCATYDAEVSMNFENSDNVTHLIVTGFTGAVGDDVDLDNDGVADNLPWTDTLDCVALLETDPSIVGEKVYCNTVVGPDNGTVPGHIYKCASGWEIGPFENCTEDTPGATNSFCTGAGLPIIENVVQTPQPVTTQEVVTIQADVFDPNGAISQVLLHWESSNGGLQAPSMNNIGGNTYEGTVPGKFPDITVWWYIETEDNDGNVVTDPPDAPATRYSYVVQWPEPTIVINEFMANSSGPVLPDSEGEWFEVYNGTNAPIDMNGWTIRDENTDLHVIDNGGPLVINPGEYQVFARDAAAMATQGVVVFYEYSNFVLGNSFDWIILESPAEQNPVAEVQYAGWTGWVIPSGASMQFGAPAPKSGKQPPPLNPNDPDNWAAAAVPFGEGDKGTPGAPNDFTIGTSVPEIATRGTRLHGNHPNPFNPSTTFSFSLDVRQHVRLVVYNARGQKIRTILDRVLDVGRHEQFRWDGRDDTGQPMSSGAYYYRLSAEDGTVQTHKMALVK